MRKANKMSKEEIILNPSKVRAPKVEEISSTQEQPNPSRIESHKIQENSEYQSLPNPSQITNPKVQERLQEISESEQIPNPSQLKVQQISSSLSIIQSNTSPTTNNVQIPPPIELDNKQAPFQASVSDIRQQKQSLNILKYVEEGKVPSEPNDSDESSDSQILVKTKRAAIQPQDFVVLKQKKPFSKPYNNNTYRENYHNSRRSNSQTKYINHHNSRQDKHYQKEYYNQDRNHTKVYKEQYREQHRDQQREQYRPKEESLYEPKAQDYALTYSPQPYSPQQQNPYYYNNPYLNYYYLQQLQLQQQSCLNQFWPNPYYPNPYHIYPYPPAYTLPINTSIESPPKNNAHTSSNSIVSTDKVRFPKFEIFINDCCLSIAYCRLQSMRGDVLVIPFTGTKDFLYGDFNTRDYWETHNYEVSGSNNMRYGEIDYQKTQISTSFKTIAFLKVPPPQANQRQIVSHFNRGLQLLLTQAQSASKNPSQPCKQIVLAYTKELGSSKEKLRKIVDYLKQSNERKYQRITMVCNEVKSLSRIVGGMVEIIGSLEGEGLLGS